MRTLYLVTYDVSHPRRLQKVFRVMRGYGDHLQLSVFRCELSEKERVQMIGDLCEQINHKEDQVLIFPLGPAGGELETGVEALGRAYEPVEKCAIVV